MEISCCFLPSTLSSARNPAPELFDPNYRSERRKARRGGILAKLASAKDVDFARIDEDLINRAIETLDALKKRGLRAVSAESCTGGLIATVLSEAPGAAEHFEGGFVVYTPPQKSVALNVSPDLIKEEGTVSQKVAVAMADGALETSNADIAVSVTGVAGPEPDEKGNPVGLVYFGCARRGRASFHEKREFGNQSRSAIRRAAAIEALTIMSRCGGAEPREEDRA